MASDKVLQVTDATFESEVIQSDGLTIVDFWAPWCAPCRAISPILDKLAEANDGKLRVAKVNVDENVQVAQQYRVAAIPTVLYVKGGAVVEQVVGSKPEKFFQELVQKHI